MKTRVLMVVIVACLLPSMVDASPFWRRASFWKPISQVCVGAAHGADAYSTVYALASGRGYEANFLLGSVTQPAAAGAVKGGIAVGSMLLSNKLFERKPKTAIAQNFASCGGLFFVAHHNMTIYRTGRR